MRMANWITYRIALHGYVVVYRSDHATRGTGVDACIKGVQGLVCIEASRWSTRMMCMPRFVAEHRRLFRIDSDFQGHSLIDTHSTMVSTNFILARNERGDMSGTVVHVHDDAQINPLFFFTCQRYTRSYIYYLAPFYSPHHHVVLPSFQSVIHHSVEP
jgi:hypothetical protein